MQRLHVLVLAAALACGPKPLRTLAPEISVSPGTVEFPAAPAGKTQQLRVEVTNKGSAELHIAAVRVAEDPDGELAVADTFTEGCDGLGRSRGNVLALAECARFSVRWSPKTAHAARGTLVIESDDPQLPLFSVPVTGSSVSAALRLCALAADGSVVPSACSTRDSGLANVPQVDFGAGSVGQAAARAVRIENTGDAPLSLLPAPYLAAGSDAAFSVHPGVPEVLGPGGHFDVQLGANPTANGSLRGALVVASNDPLAPEVTVPLLTVVAGYRLCITPEDGLDFANVPVGQSSTKTMTFENCGNVPLHLTRFNFLPFAPTTTEFKLTRGTLPTVPADFLPGDALVFDVTWKPTAVRRDNASFDVDFSLPNGEPWSGTWPVTGMGAPPDCTTGAAPVARIATYRNGATQPFDPAAVSVRPLDTITLGGGSSKVSSGSPSYAWRLASEPAGATDTLQGSGSQVKLQVRQAGDYAVELTVRDQNGCVSAPATAVLHVVPLGAVHVELTWSQSYGDVDLHYIGPGGSFYEHVPYQGDLDWEYSLATAYGPGPTTPTNRRSPDWGANNGVGPNNRSNDDASLDVDQQWGRGPENVTHAQPFDGVYRIVVHYYCASANENSGNPSQGNATATVRVWINGVPWSAPAPTATLRPYQVWDAGTVTVSGGGTNVQVAWSGSAPHDDNTGAQNCASR